MVFSYNKRKNDMKEIESNDAISRTVDLLDNTPEVKLFYLENQKLKLSKDIKIIKEIPLTNFIWIDLKNVDPKTESELEDFMKIYIQEEDELEEIELSSRFIETEDTLVANSNFLKDSMENEAVSFILKNGILVSVRDSKLRSFDETIKKIFASPKNFPTGFHIFVALLETRVEYDADMIEDANAEITQLSQTLTVTEDIDEDILLQIKNLQEKVMHLRENTIDKQRVVSNVLRSELTPMAKLPSALWLLKHVKLVWLPHGWVMTHQSCR